MRRRVYCVYILASRNRTLYVGVTGSLVGRIRVHKLGNGSKFTARYKVDRLVYYEPYQYVFDAINREKEIKGWRHEKKLDLVESENPGWEDLSDGWYQDCPELYLRDPHGLGL